MTVNRKRVALTTMCRIVDAQASGANSSKAQHERGTGRSMSAKKWGYSSPLCDLHM